MNDAVAKIDERSLAEHALTRRIAALEAELAYRQRGEELQRALYEIAALSAADSPEHDHYARLHEIVSRLMDARNFIIATYDAGQRLIRQEYLVDEDPNEVKQTFPYGEGISSLVIRSRQPWLLDDAKFRELVDCGEIRAPRGTIDFNSWMGTPLIAQDRVYGLIIVQSYSADVSYTQADLDLLTYVASHVATLVARWQSNRALKEANAELARSAETLRLVGDIGKDLTGSLDVLAICRTLEKHCAALLPMDAFGVALLSPAGDSLDYVHYVEDGVVDVVTSYPLDHPTSLAVLTLREDRELTLFNETQLHDAPTGTNVTQSAPILSAVFRPLIANGRRIGVVTVQSHSADAYHERDLEVFRSAAAYAAIALANADAYAAAEKARREAAQALIDLHQAEAHLVHSEKMASLGQLIAGVAHEINTPIGAIKSSGKNISESIGSSLLGLPKLLIELDDEHRRLFSDLITRASAPRPVLSTREERVIVRHLTERLEALGVDQARHRAGLLTQLQSHESLDDVLPLLRHPSHQLILETAYGIATITTNADNINTAVDRVAKIIFALKSFSRFGGAQVWVKSDLREGLETVLTIYQNQIKQGIELVRHFDELPLVHCLPDEINQVWTNLIHNALQAMGRTGALTIGLRQEGGDALISIGDTGCGIPPELRERIFDPFFTTKPAGEGTGLGLEIVRKIVEKHGGRISIDSEVGRGSTFIVSLPIAGAAVVPKAGVA
ncbi:MAG TPA: ATP-binding protein [Xanthomonadaceae bacterium]|jgi:two-component system NtrC family sensor kinase|nr:ATP-binding protein [Xanthomonadaceae bacterium]